MNDLGRKKNKPMKKQLLKRAQVRPFGLVLTLILVWLLAPKALCSDCDPTDLAGIKKTFVTFDEQCKKQMAGTITECFSSNIYNKVLPIMKALSKDNRFGPADRILVLGETRTGSVVSGTDRTFQTPAPVDKGHVTVSLNKLAGVSGAAVKICAVSEDGTMRRVGTVELERGNDPGEGSARLSGMQGKIIRISIVGRGTAVDKVQFSLTVN